MRRTAWLAAACVTVALLGCAARRHRVTKAPQPGPIAAVRGGAILALPNRRAVLPLGDDWPEHLGVQKDASIRAAFDTGERTRAKAYRINVEVLPEPRDGARRLEWLATPGVWSTVPITPAIDGLPNQERNTGRVIAIDMPGTPAGRELRLGSRRVGVNWIPAPGTFHAEWAASHPGTRDDPWAPTLPKPAAVSPQFGVLAWPEAINPLTRWRYRLLADGLRPVSPEPRTVEPFDDPIVEALAKQNEDRWRVALERLWVEDHNLAERVRRRLTAVVDFWGTAAAPAWPNDHAALDRLLAELLDDSLSARQRADRADAWLLEPPQFVAWVIDDAGTLDAATGVPIATVGLANLTDQPAVAWLGTRGESPDLRPIEPFTAALLRAQLGAPAGDARALSVHAGKWSTDLPIANEKLRAEPPGLNIGPFAPDDTMATWIDPPRAIPRPAWATAAMLQGYSAPSGATLFEVYVECRVPLATPLSPQDCVRVYLGPSANPRSVLRIDSTGGVSEEARRTDLLPTPSNVRLSRAADRWSFRLPVHPSCIETDGTLRLALTRHDPRGTRQAWPRPMLPWQAEPGRAAIDTRAWSAVGAPDK